MKFFIATLTLLSFCTYARANTNTQTAQCQQYEAQIIGTIKSVEYEQHAENLTCFVYLKFDLSKGDQYNENQVCPLSIDEALIYPIIHSISCQFDEYKVGQKISGVLIRQEGYENLVLK